MLPQSPETFLSEDGVRIYTDEELALQPSIPTSNDNKPDTIHRLPGYDPEKQAAPLRVQTILALEAEYDTFVSPEMYWGHKDQWCSHEDKIYYYKEQITNFVNAENSNRENDIQSVSMSTSLSSVEQVLGYSFDQEVVSVENVYNFFRNSPAGFPKLILETLQFFQCEDVGKNIISIDQLDRQLLNKIKDTFKDDINPLLADLDHSLYLHNDNIYCTNYMSYMKNSTAKLGIMMIPVESTKYQIGNAYFFPFNPLTNDQKEFINTLGSLDLVNTEGKVIIIDL